MKKVVYFILGISFPALVHAADCASAECFLNNLYATYTPTLDVLYNQNQSPAEEGE